MAIKQRDAPDEFSRCEDCTSGHAARRHLHYLRFAEESALAGHLRVQLGERGEESGQISAICAWAITVRGHYGELVDDDGLRLPVWRAWALANHQARRHPLAAPRTEAGKLVAAKWWDMLARSYYRPIEDQVRDEFLWALSAGEARER